MRLRGYVNVSNDGYTEERGFSALSVTCSRAPIGLTKSGGMAQMEINLNSGRASDGVYVSNLF